MLDKPAERQDNRRRPNKIQQPYYAEQHTHRFDGHRVNMDKWRVYVREALTQLTFARRCLAEFERAEALGDIPSVFFSLHHFIVHVANIDKLLDPKPGCALGRRIPRCSRTSRLERTGQSFTKVGAII